MSLMLQGIIVMGHRKDENLAMLSWFLGYCSYLHPSTFMHRRCLHFSSPYSNSSYVTSEVSVFIEEINRGILEIYPMYLYVWYDTSPVISSLMIVDSLCPSVMFVNVLWLLTTLEVSQRPYGDMGTYAFLHVAGYKDYLFKIVQVPCFRLNTRKWTCSWNQVIASYSPVVPETPILW